MSAGVSEVAPQALRAGKPRFSFGVISDIQYADKPVIPGRNRYEKDALNKLTSSLNSWKDYNSNNNPLKCVINLGDIIDGHEGEGAYEKDRIDLHHVINAFNNLTIPQYHVLGNHCVMNLGCEYLARELKMPHRFYDVEIEQGWRFVFLDGTDMSLMKDSSSPLEAQVYVKANQHRVLEDWNGGFGSVQTRWLKNILANAKQNNEKLILFCHWPLINQWTPDFESSLLWNAEEVLKILDPEVVFMFMSGHMHENGHTVHNNIHHVSMGAVVTTPVGDYAHAIVHVHDNRVEVEGFGIVAPLSKPIPFELAQLSLHTRAE